MVRVPLGGENWTTDPALPVNRIGPLIAEFPVLATCERRLVAPLRNAVTLSVVAAGSVAFESVKLVVFVLAAPAGYCSVMEAAFGTANWDAKVRLERIFAAASTTMSPVNPVLSPERT